MTTFDPSSHADTAKSPDPVANLGRSGAPGDDLAALAGALHADLDRATDRATARILASVGGYAEQDRVPRTDLWWSVRRNVEVVVGALASGQAPDAEQLATRRELGVRRAQQGLPLADLMRAFRVGYLEIWDLLFDLARRRGGSAVTSLAADAALVWDTMDRVSSAVGDGYREQLARSGQDRRRQGLALVAAVRDQRLPEARALFADLGHDPATAWLEVAALDRIPGTTDDPDRLVVDMVDHQLLVHVGTAPTPALPGDAVVAAATHVGLAAGPVALAGLARAIDEAELALRTARALDERLVDHADRWFDCLVVRDAHLVPDRLAAAARLLAQEPELAATVQACLDHDGNVSRAARLVHLHPNGVSYRLGRFAALCGIDPRTTAGARDASAALVLARVESASGP